MKRLRLFLLALAALLALLLALAWMLPAQVALELVGDRLQPLALRDVAGTAWEGRALQAELLGQPLGPVRWTLSPGPLLAGTVDARLTLEGGHGIQGGGRVQSDDQRTRLQDVRLELPASLLAPALDLPALVLHGRVLVQLDEAELVGGLPVSLRGTAVWEDAAVGGAAAAELGTLDLAFAPVPGGAVEGTLRDRGGPLAARGNFRLSLAGYEVEARLAARDGNPQVREALAWVGQPQADGTVLLRIEGRFLAW